MSDTTIKDQEIPQKIKDLVEEYNGKSEGNEFDVWIYKTTRRPKPNVKVEKYTGILHRHGDRIQKEYTTESARMSEVEAALEAKLTQLIQQAGQPPAQSTRSHTSTGKGK